MVMVFKKLEEDFCYPEFSKLFGQLYDPKEYGPTFHIFLNMVKKDTEQTPSVITSYYRKKE